VKVEEAEMAEMRATQLRKTLAEIDKQLLALLTRESALDHADLQKVGLYEGARVATLRLLAAAEREE
jgi:hypothetical protein